MVPSPECLIKSEYITELILLKERYTISRLKLHPSDGNFLAQSNGNYIAVFSGTRPYKMNKGKRFEGHKVRYSLSAGSFCMLFYCLLFFPNNSLRNTIGVSNSWIQIRPDILSGLVSDQTVCKCYHQRALSFIELRLD